MQRLSVWARGIPTAIFILILTAIAYRFMWDRFIGEPIENAGLGEVLLYLAEQSWLRVTALALGGFVAGLWVDWVLRKLDGPRIEAREYLGIEMINLAHDIDNARALSARFTIQDFSPRLMSAFIKAKHEGLWTPDDRMPLTVVLVYLRHVGTLLCDGHFAEAKQAALERKDAFDATLAENEKTKQEPKA